MMPFDPSQPFETVDESPTGFDPSKPFERLDASNMLAGAKAGATALLSPGEEAGKAQLLGENATPSGFATNLGKNALEIGKELPGQLAHQAKNYFDPGNFMESIASGSTAPAEDRQKEDWREIQGIANEGKRIGVGELATGHPIEAAKKFGGALYEKPVTTGMDVATMAGLGEALAGGEPAALAATKTAEEVTPVAEAGKPPVEPAAIEKPAAPSPVSIPEEAQNILNQSGKPTVAPPTESTNGLPTEIKEFLEKQGQRVKAAIPEDVQKFVSDKAKALVETPMNSGTVESYLTKNARGMALKNMGASPGQIRKIGKASAEKLADYVYDKKLASVTTGDIGSEQKVEAMNKSAGEAIGSMRQLATQRGAVHDTNKLISDINNKLGGKYESGIESGGKGSYIKALEEVAKTPPTPDKIAETITNLFKKAKNENMAANMKHLQKPEGPYADVAHELRTANENLLKKTLSEKELNIYHNALEDFGATTQLLEFQKMKWSKDMAGRLPPGMGIVRGALQKGLDVIGYRTMGQIENAVSRYMKENPSATITPKELFRHLADEAAEAAHEMGGANE